MAFRNRVVRVSQLVADQLLGVFIATATTGPRVELDNGRPRTLGASSRPGGRAVFYPSDDASASIYASRLSGSGGDPAAALVLSAAEVRVPTKIRLGAFSALLAGLDAGSVVVQTLANGAGVSIPHQLGQAPTTVVITGATSGYQVTATGSSTADDFGVLIRTPAGANPTAGVNVRVNWLALVTS